MASQKEEWPQQIIKRKRLLSLSQKLRRPLDDRDNGFGGKIG
jgi:hypothetical protein